MSWPAACLLLLPVVPLVAALRSRAAAIAGAAAAFVGLAAGGLFSDGSAAQFAFTMQAATLLVTAVAAYRFASRHSESVGSDERAALEELKRRHAQMKQEVSLGEREEAQSLQIYGVARGLAESLSWKDMTPRLTSGIQKIFGAYEFLLYAIDEESKWTLLHRRGSWSKEPPVSRVGDVAAVLHPPIVAEVVPVLAAPITMSSGGQKRTNGLLFLKIGQTDRSEAEYAKLGDDVGQQLGIAINKAMLFTQMELHSRVDGMTGALRRQAFMDRMEEEFRRAAVFHTPFSVMMIDIDFFKKVNDSHGHAAGDAVLSRVGAILKECFYETDVVGRYGGEEFIVLLPRAEAAGVLRKAESLRERLEKETIVFGFEKLKVTVSVGVAHYPQGGRSKEDLIARADKALYHAKESGRNRVVAA